MQSLLRFGLVDRLNLWLYPLLLGSGKQVFADGTVPTALRLTESVTYPNGTLHLGYETAGRRHTATSPSKSRTDNASPELTRALCVFALAEVSSALSGSGKMRLFEDGVLGGVGGRR